MAEGDHGRLGRGCADQGDDEDILDDEALYRRILRRWIVPDGSGGTKVSSAAFKDGINGELSVYRSTLTTPGEIVEQFEDQGLVSFEAGVPRGLDSYVVRGQPTDDPLGHAHAVVCPKMTRGDAKQVAAACDRIHAVPD